MAIFLVTPPFVFIPLQQNISFAHSQPSISVGYTTDSPGIANSPSQSCPTDIYNSMLSRRYCTFKYKITDLKNNMYVMGNYQSQGHQCLENHEGYLLQSNARHLESAPFAEILHIECGETVIDSAILPCCRTVSDDLL